MEKQTIKVFNSSKNALPQYQTDGSAGMDLMANIEAPVIIKKGEHALVKTGIHLQLNKNQEAQVRGRSGLAAKRGIFVHIGTIDSDYRGEIGVILFNMGKEDFEIKPGDRIAQLVIATIQQVNLSEVESADMLEETERGEGGFGHTGV